MSGDTTILTTAPADVYRQRRARLGAALTRPLLICAGHAPPRTYPANTHYFRAGSTYLYFGGPAIEDAALLIEPGSDGAAGCTLLRPVADPDDAVWVGALPRDAALTAAAGLPDAAVAAPQELPTRLAGRSAAYVAPLAARTLAWVHEAGLAAAGEDEFLPIVEQRLFKDAHELSAMRRAAEVSMAAHRAALAVAQPGRREADVAAAYMAELFRYECQPSFTPIITVHGEILHGHGYGNRLTEGALLLTDAGAEEPGGYASDITRTVPVGGQWSDIQRQLYEVVERANREATAACVPGVRYRDVHDLAARIICEGLVTADLLKGAVDELLERRAHTLFFTHGLGHLIGLDAHDMEDFGDLAGYAPGRGRRSGFGDKFLRLDRDLAAGMCVTIEPGIYLVPALWENDALIGPLADVVNRERVDALLRASFGGIRIEHTICVREAGPPEILTAALPTAAEEVVNLVGNAT